MKSFVSVFVFNALIFLLLGSERIHDLDIIPDVINYQNPSDQPQELYIPEQFDFSHDGNSFRMEDSIKLEPDKADYYEDEIQMMNDHIQEQEKELAQMNDNQKETTFLQERVEEKAELPNDYNSLKQAFMQLKQENDGDRKLNWNILSESMEEMLANVQSAREVESLTFERKKSLNDQLMKLQERSINKQKVDLAKINNKSLISLNQMMLQHQKQWLENIQIQKAKTLQQQTQDLKINDDERALQTQNMKIEMDEVSKAIDDIDAMLKIIDEYMNSDDKGSSFLQVKSSLQSIHSQLETICSKQHSKSPILDLTSSIGSLLEKDFKERQVLKEMSSLLDQLRRLTVDYRLELVGQNNENQRLYEERRAAIEFDKKTLQEVYSSKLEQLQQTSVMLEQIENSNGYQKRRNDDLDYSDKALTFLKNLWATNQGIQSRLEKELVSKAAAINDAIGNVGVGLSFSGERVD